MITSYSANTSSYNQEYTPTKAHFSDALPSKVMSEELLKTLSLTILPKTGYLEFLRLQNDILNRKLISPYPDTLLLVEHPHTFTIGKNGHRNHILLSDKSLQQMGIPIFRVDRGGQATYHGPGQVVSYPIIDIGKVGGAAKYVNALEDVIIQVLANFSLKAHRKTNQRGVWIEDRKIGSIGIKITRRIATHGFSINVNSDLSYFDNIIPCGDKGTELTSMELEMGTKINIRDVYERISRVFERTFGMCTVKLSIPSSY